MKIVDVVETTILLYIASPSDCFMQKLRVYGTYERRFAAARLSAALLGNLYYLLARYFGPNFFYCSLISWKMIDQPHSELKVLQSIEK
jgi:hypothetical protein